MITEGIISLLKNDTGVAAVVSSRVYRDVLPRGYVFPAIVVHKYARAQEYQFSGPVDVAEDHIQIDAYGSTSAARDSAIDAATSLLIGYVGTLPDGTIVQTCMLEREMDMPFLAKADATGFAFRTLLGFRIVSKRV